MRYGPLSFRLTEENQIIHNISIARSKFDATNDNDAHRFPSKTADAPLPRDTIFAEDCFAKDLFADSGAVFDG
jgi:hypothetical protein